jgi:hypothetical protein
MERIMRRLNLLASFFFASAVALAGHAGAQALNAFSLSAGLAIPFKTDLESLRTSAVITNGASDERTLHFDLLNGDPEENWEVQSWQCTLTARETVQLLIVNDGQGGSTINFECDAEEGTMGAPFAGNDGVINSDAEQGVLWVTVQNAAGQTIGDNILFGDFTLEDTATGAAASAVAAGFGGTPLPNDGDKRYAFFPGAPFGPNPEFPEYAPFPAVVATNYLPPASYPGRLLVFTLDGVPGVPPQVRARVLWYNDDEDFEDDAFDFKCMDFLDYGAIAPGLAALTTAGHMEITPVLHPGEFPGTFDDTKSPLLCYNIQDAPGGGSTMRPCAQSTSFYLNIDPVTGVARGALLDTQLP